MICAPVIIPTLNRSEHLIRLLNSLKENMYAKDTEIYIGVDYPPLPKYEEGHKKICDYLGNGELEGFRKVYVFYHKENIGVVKNIRFLVNQVRVNYDRYIFTEDDNEFSPNFLEYINLGLEQYAEDKSIIGICGHAYQANWEYSEDTVYKNPSVYDCWGMGRWIAKQDEMDKTISLTYLEQLMQNVKRARHLYQVNQQLFYMCIRAVMFHDGPMFREDGSFWTMDTNYCIYMIDCGKYTINPILSKSRNWGDDGSGEHGGTENRGQYQRIDTNTRFVFPKDEDIVCDKKIDEIMNAYLSCSTKDKIKGNIFWLIFFIKSKCKMPIRKK